MFAVALLAVSLYSRYTFCSESAAPADVVRAFYTSYLDYDYRRDLGKPEPDMPKSESFTAAIKENSEICSQHATGICGWGGNGDPYLAGAQETDPDLNSINSGLVVKEIKSGYVQVQLNVYPSISDAEGYYQITMVYKMVWENGLWVADDIGQDGKSDRKAMLEENAHYLQNPDPDSPAAIAKTSSKRKKQWYGALASIFLVGVVLLTLKARSKRK